MTAKPLIALLLLQLLFR